MRVARYAAIFDRPDSGGDVVRRGAFAESLKRVRDVPLLLQHKGQPVGRIEHLSEDKRGLQVIARVDDRRTAELVRRGLEGLSFGYRVREANAAGALRQLRELYLVEVSLVARPMQKLARVHAIDSSAGQAMIEQCGASCLLPLTSRSEQQLSRPLGASRARAYCRLIRFQ